MKIVHCTSLQFTRIRWTALMESAGDKREGKGDIADWKVQLMIEKKVR